MSDPASTRRVDRRLRWSVRLVALCLSCCLLSFAFLAAAGGGESALFRRGTEALALGKFEEAIEQFEAFADREPSHPDASFNRGMAYLLRVRSGAERNGDLGRAAAAFEETLIMRSDDDDARHGLSLIHAEVARRRARSGKPVVISSPSLDRLIVNLASARSWGIGAVVASFLLALGLLLRRRSEGPVHLAGTLLWPLSLVALAALLPLTLVATDLQRSSRPGVLVLREAFMMDEKGVTLGGDPISEATRLELGQRRGGRVSVRYGVREGWLDASSVRPLRTR